MYRALTDPQDVLVELGDRAIDNGARLRAIESFPALVGVCGASLTGLADAQASIVNSMSTQLLGRVREIEGDASEISFRAQAEALHRQMTPLFRDFQERTNACVHVFQGAASTNLQTAPIDTIEQSTRALGALPAQLEAHKVYIATAVNGLFTSAVALARQIEQENQRLVDAIRVRIAQLQAVGLPGIALVGELQARLAAIRALHPVVPHTEPNFEDLNQALINYSGNIHSLFDQYKRLSQIVLPAVPVPAPATAPAPAPAPGTVVVPVPEAKRGSDSSLEAPSTHYFTLDYKQGRLTLSHRIFDNQKLNEKMAEFFKELGVVVNTPTAVPVANPTPPGEGLELKSLGSASGGNAPTGGDGSDVSGEFGLTSPMSGGVEEHPLIRHPKESECVLPKHFLNYCAWVAKPGAVFTSSFVYPTEPSHYKSMVLCLNQLFQARFLRVEGEKIARSAGSAMGEEVLRTGEAWHFQTGLSNEDKMYSIFDTALNAHHAKRKRRERIRNITLAVTAVCAAVGAVVAAGVLLGGRSHGSGSSDGPSNSTASSSVSYTPSVSASAGASFTTFVSGSASSSRSFSGSSSGSTSRSGSIGATCTSTKSAGISASASESFTGSPSLTVTATRTSSRSASPSASVSAQITAGSASVTASTSKSSSGTESPSLSVTTTSTATLTDSATASVTITTGVSATVSASDSTSSSNTVSGSSSDTSSESSTKTPSITVSHTESPSTSATITGSATVTASTSSTGTPSIKISASPSPSPSPSASASESSSESGSGSTSGSSSESQSGSVSGSASSTPTMSQTPSITLSGSFTSTPTVSVDPSGSITITTSGSPSVSVTLPPSVTSTASVSVSQTASGSLTFSLTSSASSSASATFTLPPSPSSSVSASSTTSPIPFTASSSVSPTVGAPSCYVVQIAPCTIGVSCKPIGLVLMGGTGSGVFTFNVAQNVSSFAAASGAACGGGICTTATLPLASLSIPVNGTGVVPSAATFSLPNPRINWKGFVVPCGGGSFVAGARRRLEMVVAKTAPDVILSEIKTFAKENPEVWKADVALRQDTYRHLAEYILSSYANPEDGFVKEKARTQMERTLRAGLGSEDAPFIIEAIKQAAATDALYSPARLLDVLVHKTDPLFIMFKDACKEARDFSIGAAPLEAYDVREVFSSLSSDRILQEMNAFATSHPLVWRAHPELRVAAYEEMANYLLQNLGGSGYFGAQSDLKGIERKLRHLLNHPEDQSLVREALYRAALNEMNMGHNKTVYFSLRPAVRPVDIEGLLTGAAERTARDPSDILFKSLLESVTQAKSAYDRSHETTLRKVVGRVGEAATAVYNWFRGASSTEAKTAETLERVI